MPWLSPRLTRGASQCVCLFYVFFVFKTTTSEDESQFPNFGCRSLGGNFGWIYTSLQDFEKAHFFFLERSRTIYSPGEQILVDRRHVDGKKNPESIQDRLDMIQWTWSLQVVMDHTIAIVSGLGVLREVRECETCPWSYPVKNPCHVFFPWRRPPKLEQEPGKKQHTAKWKIIHDDSFSSCDDRQLVFAC